MWATEKTAVLAGNGGTDQNRTHAHKKSVKRCMPLTLCFLSLPDKYQSSGSVSLLLTELFFVNRFSISDLIMCSINACFSVLNALFEVVPENWTVS
jgi:hypothetical protein